MAHLKHIVKHKFLCPWAFCYCSTISLLTSMLHNAQKGFWPFLVLPCDCNSAHGLQGNCINMVSWWSLVHWKPDQTEESKEHVGAGSVKHIVLNIPLLHFLVSWTFQCSDLLTKCFHLLCLFSWGWWYFSVWISCLLGLTLRWCSESPRTQWENISLHSQSCLWNIIHI